MQQRFLGSAGYREALYQPELPFGTGAAMRVIGQSAR
jgi:hypothetical protein